jgi:hypothetical protein
LKETRPLWPPQRGVGLREPNLGKTNPCVTLHYSLAICFAPSLADSFIFLTLTRLVVVFIFVNFSFALFTPPLGDYQDNTHIYKGFKFLFLDFLRKWVLQILPPLKIISSSRFKKVQGKGGENLCEALLLFPMLLHLLHGDSIILCTSLSPYFL